MPKSIYTVTYFKLLKFPEDGCKTLLAMSKKEITEGCIKGRNRGREKTGLHRTSLEFGESSSEGFKFRCLRVSTGYLLKSKLPVIILSQISQDLPFQVRFFFFFFF